MLSKLNELAPNVPVERALCIDIKNVDWAMPDNIRPGYWSSDRWRLGPSDIEIFRSHMDCWKRISKSGELGIVLEDDLIFSENFKEIINVMDKKELNGIFRLDGVAVPLLMNKQEKINKNFSVSKIDSIAPSAAAYVLDPITAENLIESAKVDRTLDDYLFDPTPIDRRIKGHGLLVYQIEPVVAVQAQFGTYSEKLHYIPNFLKLTKRNDVKQRKSKFLKGPILYRLRRELMRKIYKYRLKKRKKNIIARNGAWRKPKLSKDLSWDLRH